MDDTEFILINVYAPTKDKVGEQMVFVEKLAEYVEEFADKQIIWAGDFNTYLEPEKDKKGGVKERPSEYSLKIQGLMEDYDILDVWRLRNHRLYPCGILP